ncbi:MAG: YHS domain-containing protein [Chloroflexi bacterium]|nr:MAG: YHS domain-containing protein [Chloroflexota bacterium]
MDTTREACMKDPVCGTEVMPGQEEAEMQYQGQTYHFCSRECRDLFAKNPGEYLKAAQRQ